MKHHIFTLLILLSACTYRGNIEQMSQNATQSNSVTDPNLDPSNIKYGVSIFGVIGTYIGSFQKAMSSQALRDVGSVVVSNLATQTTSQQMSLESEQNLYKNGANLPTTAGFNYRDIPDTTKDDDGYYGINCKYAARPSNNCGTTQTTIDARIADCAVQNPTTSFWNGATQCNNGQGSWKLVTRSAANKEVWQDQRTGQFWSSQVGAVNWCQASGNTQLAPVTYANSYNGSVGTPIQGNGTIGSLVGGSSSQAEVLTITFTSATTFSVVGTAGASGCQAGTIVSGGLTTTPGSSVTFSRTNYCSFTLTQGSTNFANNDKFVISSADAALSCAPGASSGLQPASAISYCSEAAGVNAPAGETWASGVYQAAKGGMGKTATATSPSVRWRLPTINDYMLANLNGIRMVMPDMGRPSRSDGSPGTGGVISFSTTVTSDDPANAHAFDQGQGSIQIWPMTFSGAARCIGR